MPSLRCSFISFTAQKKPPQAAAAELLSRSALGDDAFTEQAVNFVLKGGMGQKFDRQGKGKPHAMYLKLIPCAVRGPVAVYWQDTSHVPESPSQKGKMGEVVAVNDELARAEPGEDAFQGEAYFDRHLEQEELFFTITLRSRSLFLLAATTLEKEMWVCGFAALQSGAAARLPATRGAVSGLEAAPAWMRKVTTALLAGEMVSEPHSTRQSAWQDHRGSLATSRTPEDRWSRDSGSGTPSSPDAHDRLAAPVGAALAPAAPPAFTLGSALRRC